MTTLQRQFLELLKAGLWGNVPDINLFQSSVDWNGILRIAAGHTVQVIIADGIELLPETIWPPKDAIMKLMMVRTKTRQMHSLINATLNKIVNALNAENIPSVLLKGQGVAQNYRNPESRMCGDIDLYVGVNNFSKACDIVKNMGDGTFEGEESEQHTHLRLDNVEIEIHRVVQHLANRSLNKKFHRLTVENIDDNFGTSELGVWNNNGTEIMLSPATFDSFFILHHAIRHMTSEGIGFRHICDWMRYLRNHHDEVNIDELGKALKSFKMKTAWDVFGRMAVEYLGLPEEELPLCPDASRSRKADRLLDMIFISGNFGRFDEKGRDRSKTTYLKQKWRSFRYQNLRLCKLFSLFPSYSITFWWGWLTNGIKVVLQGK